MQLEVRPICDGFMRENLSESSSTLYLEVSERQRKKGMEKYGTALSTQNGRDAFQDILEEFVDCTQYLTQLKLEGFTASQYGLLFEMFGVLRKLLDAHVNLELMVHANTDFPKAPCPPTFEKGTLGEVLDNAGLLK